MAEVRTTRSRAVATLSTNSELPAVVSPSASPSPISASASAAPATASNNAKSMATAVAAAPLTTNARPRFLRPRRPKVLCLGMSYPSVQAQLQYYGLDAATWLDNPPMISVQEVVQCVSQGLLTEMDARDLARVISTEQVTNVDVYTVSQENAAQYEASRHVWANFNRQTFCNLLVKAFGPDNNSDNNTQHHGRSQPATTTNSPNNNNNNNNTKGLVQFRQVILDYYWIPQGWDVSHWSPAFFARTLVQLVTEGLMNMDDDNTEKSSGTSLVPCGIYIPFCFHCFRQIINALPILSQYFAISFLRKKDLHEISLWKGTQSIDPFIMQSCLGKQLDQEDVYCTFGSQEVRQAMTGPDDISQEELCEILSRLEDFHDIRMMKLRPLKQHNIKKPVSKSNYEKGGLKGLVDPRKVQRGFSDLPPVNVLLPIVVSERLRPRPKAVTVSKSSCQKRKPQSASSTTSQSNKKRRSQAPPKAKRAIFPSSKTYKTTKVNPTAVKSTPAETSSYSITTRSRKPPSLPASSPPPPLPTRTCRRPSTSPFARKRATAIVAAEEKQPQSACRRRLELDDPHSVVATLPQKTIAPKASMVEAIEAVSETEAKFHRNLLQRQSQIQRAIGSNKACTGPQQQQTEDSPTAAEAKAVPSDACDNTGPNALVEVSVRRRRSRRLSGAGTLLLKCSDENPTADDDVVVISPSPVPPSAAMSLASSSPSPGEQGDDSIRGSPLSFSN